MGEWARYPSVCWRDSGGDDWGLCFSCAVGVELLASQEERGLVNSAAAEERLRFQADRAPCSADGSACSYGVMSHPRRRQLVRDYRAVSQFLSDGEQNRSRGSSGSWRSLRHRGCGVCRFVRGLSLFIRDDGPRPVPAGNDRAADDKTARCSREGHAFSSCESPVPCQSWSGLPKRHPHEDAKMSTVEAREWCRRHGAATLTAKPRRERRLSSSADGFTYREFLDNDVLGRSG
jgi:hypothetical protein